MRALGIASRIRKGRPVAKGVIIEVDEDGERTAHEAFDHVGDQHEDFAQSLVYLERQLESVWPSFGEIDAVVIRSMDHSPARRKRATNQTRYAVEGVLLATCRKKVETVQSLTGRQIGSEVDMNKAEADEWGASMTSEGAAEAAAAALAGTRIGA